MDFSEIDYDSQREHINAIMYKLLDSDNEFQILTNEVIYSFETISIEKQTEIHHVNSEEDISFNTKITVYFENSYLHSAYNENDVAVIVMQGMDRLSDLSFEDKKLFYKVIKDLKID